MNVQTELILQNQVNGKIRPCRGTVAQSSIDSVTVNIYNSTSLKNISLCRIVASQFSWKALGQLDADQSKIVLHISTNKLPIIFPASMSVLVNVSEELSHFYPA